MRIVLAVVLFVVLACWFAVAYENHYLFPPADKSFFQGAGSISGVPPGDATVVIPLGWLWGWLAGELEQQLKTGWDVSTGNPPSGPGTPCCGGGGGGGFGGDGPTNYPNDAKPNMWLNSWFTHRD